MPNPRKPARKTTPRRKPSRTPRAKHNPAKPDVAHTTVKTTTGTKPYGQRADLGAPAALALDRMPEPERTTAWALDSVIHALSDEVEAKVAWGNAAYKVDGHDLFSICQGRGFVYLYIGNGAHLLNDGELLEGSGKAMRHVKVRSTEQARSLQVKRLMKSALSLANQGVRTAWNRKKDRP